MRAADGVVADGREVQEYTQFGVFQLGRERGESPERRLQELAVRRFFLNPGNFSEGKA